MSAMALSPLGAAVLGAAVLGAASRFRDALGLGPRRPAVDWLWDRVRMLECQRKMDLATIHRLEGSLAQAADTIDDLRRGTVTAPFIVRAKGVL